MATEEQIQNNNSEIVGHSTPETLRMAQKLTISNRIVSKLSFRMNKTGSPTGDVKFNIYAADDDELLASVVQGDASALTGTFTFYEAAFSSPVLINEEVYICVVKDTNLSGVNYINVRRQISDVKADEFTSRYRNGAWVDSTTHDTAYIYTYVTGAGGGTPPIFPSDAQTRVTSLTHRYDRGTYTLELGLGEVVADFGIPTWEPIPQAPLPEPSPVDPIFFPGGEELLP